ncbi:MAG: hypothetical protein ACTS8R_03815 [Arsenophonus sp. NC-QC1-MAG3]
MLESECYLFFIHTQKSLVIVVKLKTESENTTFRLFTSVSIKKDFPQLTIEVNGNMKNVNNAKQHLHHFDDIMISQKFINILCY